MSERWGSNWAWGALGSALTWLVIDGRWWQGVFAGAIGALVATMISFTNRRGA